MNTIDSDSSGFAEPKRPARITGKVNRRGKVAIVPPPSDEPVPWFDEPASTIVDEWMNGFAHVGDLVGAFGFEVHASAICSIVVQAGRMAAEGLIDGDPLGPFIGELVRRRDELSLAALTCFGRMDGGEFGTRAGIAAQSLRAQGLIGGETRSWIADLDRHWVADECADVEIVDSTDRMLLVTFSDGAVIHGIALMVDDEECGEAAMIVSIAPTTMAAGEGLTKLFEELLKVDAGVKITPIDPAEARFRLETAISRRADHDSELEADELLEDLFDQVMVPEGPLDDDEDAQAPYLPLLPLLTTRLVLLPDHGRELPPHPVGLPRSNVLEALLQEAGVPSGFGGIDFDTTYGDVYRRKPLSAMPEKRRRSDGPAPVYRVRVDLKGAKPPIWRRLELAADSTLHDVHRLIQAAFGWDDFHLHVFETDYGSFSAEGDALGPGGSGSVTLEQVMRAPGEKLEYVYDFGDEWTHMIKLEAVLAPEPGLKPRCTGGRRAAPPEDCGGIRAYEEAGPTEGPDTFDREELNRIFIENL